jgi:hypothetical protein
LGLSKVALNSSDQKENLDHVKCNDYAKVSLPPGRSQSTMSPRNHHSAIIGSLVTGLGLLSLAGCCRMHEYAVPAQNHQMCDGLCPRPAASLLGPLGCCCPMPACTAREGGNANTGGEPVPHSKFHPVPTRPVFAPRQADWLADNPSGQPFAPCDPGCCPCTPSDTCPPCGRPVLPPTPVPPPSDWPPPRSSRPVPSARPGSLPPTRPRLESLPTPPAEAGRQNQPSVR